MRILNYKMSEIRIGNNRNQTKNLEDELFNIAEKNLGAAKLCYNNTFYSQAVFLLQQSAETLYKAYGLKEGIIKSSELQSQIGHEAWKITIRKIKSKIEEIKSRVENEGLFPIIAQLRKRAEKRSPRLAERIKTFLNNLNNMLEVLEALEEFLNSKEGRQEILELSFSPQSTLPGLSTRIKEIINICEKISDFVKRIEQLPKIFQNLEVKNKVVQLTLTIGLTSINIILDPHITISRYPDINTNYWPSNYTKDVPLIKNFDYLLELQQKNLTLYRDLKNKNS